MKRFRQFGLRTILLLTLVVSVLCGLLVARMATVRRYNRVHDAVVRATNDVLFAKPDARPSMGRWGYRASLFSSGRLHISVLDEEEEFHVTVECWQSGVLYGRPAVVIRLDDFLGDRPLDAKRNREIADEIVRLLPADVEVEVTSDTEFSP